jgi:hypothetical protein
MNTSLDNPRVGLCAACAHAHVIRHPRGGPDYWRCTRADTDPRYAKYPRLPILRCPGFQPLPKE